jgi:hypothetical protein
MCNSSCFVVVCAPPLGGTVRRVRWTAERMVSSRVKSVGHTLRAKKSSSSSPVRLFVPHLPLFILMTPHEVTAHWPRSKPKGPWAIASRGFLCIFPSLRVSIFDRQMSLCRPLSLERSPITDALLVPSLYNLNANIDRWKTPFIGLLFIQLMDVQPPDASTVLIKELAKHVLLPQRQVQKMPGTVLTE